jgi:predicted AAA+ superfamily ATPase
MEQTTTLSQITDALLLFRPQADSLLAQAAQAGTPEAPAQVSRLITMAATLGWEGNLWHCALTQQLLEHTNPFSLACERRTCPKDSLWQAALADMAQYRALFDWPLTHPLLQDFHHEAPAGRLQSGQDVSALALALAQADTPEAMLALLTDHYERLGLGMLGLGQIFRVRETEGRAQLYPVENRRPVMLRDLVGYETQKAQLLENTLSFLRGHHPNNVLLYGDAGTGKSTSIQAIANEYAPQGLRLIELYKNQFGLIPDVLSQIKGRNYRFILFLDDLSFEENEVAYKHLKAVMEGGAEAAPENVLIYATSNRRHLVKETWNDRSDMEHDGDIHRSDTMEEKLSLAARFGLQIYYPNPTFEEYHTIVQTLAEKTAGLENLTAEQLRAAASTWQVRHGSRSGRTAQQFISDLLCRAPESDQERNATHADS